MVFLKSFWMFIECCFNLLSKYCLEPTQFIIWSNRFFAAGNKSLSHNVDLAGPTNSKWKMIDGILLVIDAILTVWKWKESSLSNILYMNLPLSIEISKSRRVVWLPLFPLLILVLLDILRKTLPNSPFKAQKSINQKVL